MIAQTLGLSPELAQGVSLVLFVMSAFLLLLFVARVHAPGISSNDRYVSRGRSQSNTPVCTKITHR